jgi:hypothetical protein
VLFTLISLIHPMHWTDSGPDEKIHAHLPRAGRRSAGSIALAFSFIRTITVGPGIAPDLLTPPKRALAGLQPVQAAYRR